MKLYVDAVKELIAAVERHPGVYDPNNSKFRSPSLREQCWEKIGQELNYGADEAKNRWRVVRDRYVREHRLIQLEQIALEEIKFPYFHLMRFLDPFIKRRKSLQKWTPFPKQENGSYHKTTSNSTLTVVPYNTVCTMYEKNEFDYNISSDANYSEPVDMKEVHSYQVEQLINEDEDDSNETNILEESVENNEDNNIMVLKNENSPIENSETDNADDLFCKMLSISLKSLNRVNNMKAKSEIFQVLQKYVEKEEENK